MRTSVWRAVGAALVVGCVMAGPVAAHHGWSGYDDSRVLNLAGTIREAGYEHPHGFIRLAAPDKVWLVVLAPPSRMERRGLPKDALAVGKAVTVAGYPHRSVSDEMRAETITIDGKKVELR